MLQKRVSQTDLAKSVGYSTTGVWNWLQGNTFPRPETFGAIARFLGVDQEWLLGIAEENTQDEALSERALVSETVADRVEGLRSEIAMLLGYEVGRVRISVEFAPA